jgi:hypothetical protein
MRKQLDEAIVAQAAQEQGAVGELAKVKLRKTSLEDRLRALVAKCDGLKAELKVSQELNAAAAAKATAEAQEAAAEEEAAKHRGAQMRINLGCWSWVLVCLPASSQTSAATPAGAASIKASMV